MNNGGGVEQRARSKIFRGALKTAILQVAATVGILSLAVVAPNTLKAIPRETLNLVFNRRKNSRNVTISRLVKEGFLTREHHRGTRVLRITSKGLRYLEHERQKHALKRPGKWDRHWRIVAFDIGEKRRKTRDALRRELRSAGFFRLQDSMWVYPFPCEDFIALLKADLRVGKDILYVVAREIENDAFLQKHFRLVA